MKLIVKITIAFSLPVLHIGAITLLLGAVKSMLTPGNHMDGILPRGLVFFLHSLYI